MKTVFALSIILLLTGCSLSRSKQVETAEQILHQFECKNIDNAQLAHNPITGFHLRSLSVSKDKASHYIESFKHGDSPTEMPLEQMVEQEYLTFKSACQFLGGVTLEIEDDTKQQNS